MSIGQLTKFLSDAGVATDVSPDDPLPMGSVAFGSVDDEPTTDPDSDATVISLLKTLVASVLSTVATAIKMVATTNNGTVVTRLLSAGSENTGISVTTAATTIYGVSVWNKNAAARYLKIYDKATAAAAADTPKLVVQIPATGYVSDAIPSIGLPLLNGFSYRIVTGATDADNTAVAAGDIDVTFIRTP